MKAKKRLGQNFLIDNNIINKIVDQVKANEEDLIIEIGPGRGALTKKLKEKNAYLIAYEYDLDLKPILSELENNKTRIIYNDILSANIKKDIESINYNKLYLVGNLPYYITTPIIEYIIEQKLLFNSFTIMVQKEVADRFLSKPKTKEYGYFTVLLNYHFNIEKVCDVSNKCFSPTPKVQSTVINLKYKENNWNIKNEEKYFQFLKDSFSQKRKTLKNNLVNYDWNIINSVLKSKNLPETIRAEEISEEIFVEIYNHLL